MGEKNFYIGMRRYFNEWKFKHPEPNDFMRIMEKTSGLELHWFMRYFINSNKKIDYEIRDVVDSGERTEVVLARLGDIPMPIDLIVTFKDGTKQMQYIPSNEMMGGKPAEDTSIKTEVLPDWAWVNPTYKVVVYKPYAEIISIEIDPSQRMADINKANNKWTGQDAPKGTGDNN
jgi:hypothetical protein